MGLPVCGSNLLPQVFVNVAPGLKNIFIAIPPIANPTIKTDKRKTSMVVITLLLINNFNDQNVYAIKCIR